MRRLLPPALSAATMAATAVPIPSASVAMCPASEMSASEPVSHPATASTIMKTTTKTNTTIRGLTCRLVARIV